MSQLFLSLFSGLSILFSCSPFGYNVNVSQNNFYMANKQLAIKVGASTFKATLLDNSTTQAFKAMLPLSSDMKELNRNEKYGELPGNLITNATNPKTIQSDDLML